MKTYKILVGKVVHVGRQLGYDESTRRDFADLMGNNVSASLICDLMNALADRLCMDANDVRGAWAETMWDWQHPAQEEQKLDWDSIAVGTELYDREHGWVRAVDDTRQVRKGCHGTEAIYHVADWGWRTLDELKEQFWLVER